MSLLQFEYSAFFGVKNFNSFKERIILDRGAELFKIWDSSAKPQFILLILV